MSGAPTGTLAAWRAAIEVPMSAWPSASPEVAEIARLRKKHSAEVVACLIERARAHEKALRKFPKDVADRLVGDMAGMEMASSWAASAHKAARYRRVLGAGASVVDLCCGIGGDAMALAGAGLSVVGVDRDQVRAWMCGLNAGCATMASDIRAADVPGGAFHVDPARRDGDGRRSRGLAAMEPSLEVIESIIEAREHGGVKLAPGVHAAKLPAGEVEFISERGRLTQAVLWTGSLAGVARRATRLVDGQADDEAAALVGEPSRSEEVCDLSRYIFTMDPSVERADLVPVLMARTGLDHVQPGVGLLTGDAPVDDPMIAGFEVLAEMPWRRTRLAAWVREHGGGVVEVKTRGGVVDTDREQKALRGDGDTPMVVFVLRFGTTVRAVVAKRV